MTQPLEMPAFPKALDWLVREHEYTLAKFGQEQDNLHIEDFNLVGTDGNDWWQQQLDTYLHRARILGLSNPGGRQALAKYVSTALGMLTACVEVYGDLPEPGVSSGEIKMPNTSDSE